MCLFFSTKWTEEIGCPLGTRASTIKTCWKGLLGWSHLFLFCLVELLIVTGTRASLVIVQQNASSLSFSSGDEILEWPAYAYSFCPIRGQTQADYLFYWPDACQSTDDLSWKGFNSTGRSKEFWSRYAEYDPLSSLQQRYVLVAVANCPPKRLVDLALFYKASTLILLPTSAFEEFGFAFRHVPLGTTDITKDSYHSDVGQTTNAIDCLPTFGISYRHALQLAGIVEHKHLFSEQVGWYDRIVTDVEYLFANLTSTNDMSTSRHDRVSFITDASPSPFHLLSWTITVIFLELLNLILLCCLVRFLSMSLNYKKSTLTPCSSSGNADEDKKTENVIHDNNNSHRLFDSMSVEQTLSMEPLESSPVATPASSFDYLPRLPMQDVAESGRGGLQREAVTLREEVGLLCWAMWGGWKFNKTDCIGCLDFKASCCGHHATAEQTAAWQKKKWLIGELLLCIFRFFVLIEPLPFGISFHSHFTLIVLQSFVFLCNWILSSLVCLYVFAIARKTRKLVYISSTKAKKLLAIIGTLCIPFAVVYLGESVLRGLSYSISDLEQVDAFMISFFLVWLTTMYTATAIELEHNFPFRFWALLASAVGVCFIVFGFLLMSTISIDNGPSVLPLKCFFVWFGSVWTGFANFWFFASSGKPRRRANDSVSA